MYLYVTAAPNRYGCGTYFRRLTCAPPHMNIKKHRINGLEPSAVFFKDKSMIANGAIVVKTPISEA